MADQYDTVLSEAEESKFQAWKELHYPKDSGYDYDLRGAFKAGMKPDPETGHGDDLFKKPNHPTFSIYSKWAKDFPEKAGTWDGDTYIPHPKPKKFGDGGSANLPPEQDESLIDMATRYGQGVMRNHPVITRGLASIVTEPLDAMQWLVTHGVDPEVAATMTPEEFKERQEWASSIPNAGELANKYLTQAGVRESETLPEKIGELGVGLVGPALLAKGPKAFSWGKRILGKMDLPKATALTKASGGPVHMGKGGLLKAGAEELVELAAKYLPKAGKSGLPMDEASRMGVGKGELPKLHSDNPGGDWLKYKQEDASKAGLSEWNTPKRIGTVTGSFDKELTIPVSILKNLKGMRGEQTQVRKDDLSWLKKKMESGKLPEGRLGEEYAPFVQVDQNGNAWVSEGNHRIMAADQLGWKSMPVEVRYYNGGENVDGIFHPSKINDWHGLPRFEEPPLIRKASGGLSRRHAC